MAGNRIDTANVVSTERLAKTFIEVSHMKNGDKYFATYLLPSTPLIKYDAEKQEYIEFKYDRKDGYKLWPEFNDAASVTHEDLSMEKIEARVNSFVARFELDMPY